MKINKTIYAILPVLFACLCINARAQNSLFTIEHEKVHVLYSNFENPLKIVSFQKFDSLTVEYDYYVPIYADERDKDRNVIILDSTLMKGVGSVKKGASENSFTVEVSYGVKARLNFHLHGKVIESRDYKILVVPELVLKLGNACSSDAEIALEELRKIKGLTCEKIDWEYEEQYEITRFELSIVGPSKINTFRGTTGLFSQEMLDALSKVKVGDKVYVESVVAEIGGMQRPIIPLAFRISK